MLSGYCYSQEPVFNFESNKLYKISMKGLSSPERADMIARTVEKMQIVIFSYFDPMTKKGYCIVDNFYKVHEIEKALNNNGFIYYSYEEIPLNEDNFLEMYMKRSGIESKDFSTNPPKKYTMGPFNKLTDDLYNKALETWNKKYKSN